MGAEGTVPDFNAYIRQMRFIPPVLASLLVALSCAPVIAQNAESYDEIRGSEFVQPISHSETTFQSITDRFGKPVGSAVDFPTAGMKVTFANKVTLIEG